MKEIKELEANDVVLIRFLPVVVTDKHSSVVLLHFLPVVVADKHSSVVLIHFLPVVVADKHSGVVLIRFLPVVVADTRNSIGTFQNKYLCYTLLDFFINAVLVLVYQSLHMAIGKGSGYL